MPMAYPPFNNVAHPNELPPHVLPPGTPLIGATRGDSTALVSPAVYDPPIGPFVATPNRSSGTRKVKLVLGGAALTLLAAAATIAIIRHSSGSDDAGDVAESTDKTDKPVERVTPASAAAPEQPKHGFKPPLPPTSPTPPMPPPAPVAPLPTSPQRPNGGAIAPAPIPAPTPTPSAHPTPAPPPTPVSRPTPPTPQVTVQPPQPHPVATPSLSADDLRTRAAAFYRQKEFARAAQSLRDGYKNMSAVERKNLPSLAKYYDWVGNGFLVGSSSRATDAFAALSTAIAADRNLEGAYIAELEPKQQALAAKAALSFAISGQLESALSAIHIAESAGVGAGTVQAARSKLDQKASELYNKASAEQESNPKDAKALARQILRFVDQKSIWYAKAQSLLAS
jgi:outer membrane biosynthesis protein TonB